MPHVQQGITDDELLCGECDQAFGRTERTVQRNWEAMRRSGPETHWRNRGWKRLVGEEAEKQERYKRWTRDGWKCGAYPERWTGVDGEAWRKGAAINAWRMAASAKHAGMESSEVKLRELVDTGLWNGRRPELLFAWWGHQEMGLVPGDEGMEALEIPPRMDEKGDILTRHGGIGTLIATGRRGGLERAYRFCDVGDDGTWPILEMELREGKAGQSLVAAVRRVAEKHNARGKRR